MEGERCAQKNSYSPYEDKNWTASDPTAACASSCAPTSAPQPTHRATPTETVFAALAASTQRPCHPGQSTAAPQHAAIHDASQPSAVALGAQRAR